LPADGEDVTGTVAATGSAEIARSTSDGGDVPDTAQVCAGTVLPTVPVTSTSVSTTTLTFPDLAPGTDDVTVTNAVPYQHTTSTNPISGGETQSRDTVLQRAAVTMLPPQIGAAASISTTTIAPTSPPAGRNDDSGVGRIVPTNASSPTGGAPQVVAHLNTGAGHDDSSSSIVILLLAILMVVRAGTFTWRRRVQ